MMADHFGAIEADFQRFYGLDLRETLRTTGVRRLWSLLRGLPPSSALRREIDPAVDWDQRTELLAAIAELVDVGNRMFFAANAKQGAKAPEPIAIRRPWDEPAPSKLPIGETLRRLAGMLRSGG